MALGEVRAGFGYGVGEVREDVGLEVGGKGWGEEVHAAEGAVERGVGVLVEGIEVRADCLGEQDGVLTVISVDQPRKRVEDIPAG